MDNLETCEYRVMKLLEKHPRMRGDDELLYLAFLRGYLPDIGGLSVETFMKRRRFMGIPTIESMGRARRRVQERRPDLLPPKDRRQIRREEERRYRAYYGRK